MVTKWKCLIALLLCVGLTPVAGAQRAPVAGQPARQILEWNEVDQLAWIGDILSRGIPAESGDYLSALVRGKSAITLPVIEKKIEEVMKSKDPISCFSDKSVDPQRFIGVAASTITGAGNNDSLKAIGKLMKIDENRFGRFVQLTLWNALESSNNALSVAYSGFEIGDPPTDRRIVAWIEPLLTSKVEYDVVRTKELWADAMVERYAGPPTEAQWASDPIASRLKRPLAESLHSDIIRLSVDAMRKRRPR